MRTRDKRLDTLTNISGFTGPLVFKDTGKAKMCDWCGTERSAWKHWEKKTNKVVYLCFKCGDH